MNIYKSQTTFALSLFAMFYIIFFLNNWVFENNRCIVYELEFYIIKNEISDEAFGNIKKYSVIYRY